MFDEIKEKQFILQLFNLEYSDVQDVGCIRAGNNVIIDITLASDPVPCHKSSPQKQKQFIDYALAMPSQMNYLHWQSQEKTI